MVYQGQLAHGYLRTFIVLRGYPSVTTNHPGLMGLNEFTVQESNTCLALDKVDL